MIEVIYKEEKQETPDDGIFVHIPRNIRQIGLVHENYKIYIEDYVYTFLVRLSRSEDEKEGRKGRIAVLTGETKWHLGISYLFIKGALMTEDMEAAADHIDFTEEVWGRIHEEQEKYFEEQEIVGWFFSQPQIPMEMTELFARVHLRHFGGEKVLMLMEPLEREDAFFRYENSSMAKQSGYYIYYEKNPQMQAYMIEKNKELQPEITEKCDDTAVKSFREIITNKKSEAEETPSVFSYAATACLAIAVLVVGVNFYRNYQSVKSIENETKQASSVIVEEITPKAGKEEQSFEASDYEEDEKEPEEAKDDVKNDKTGQNQENAQITAEENTEENTEESADRNSEKVSEDEEQSEQEEAASSSVYKEEADIRKAKRREALEKAEKEQKASSDNVHETYVIKPGDTLFQISMSRYGNMEAMQEICKLNGLSLEEIIYPGEVIILP